MCMPQVKSPASVSPHMALVPISVAVLWDSEKAADQEKEAATDSRKGMEMPRSTPVSPRGAGERGSVEGHGG